MNPKKFLDAAQRLTVYIGAEAPHVIGQTIVNDIKENFNKESYEGKKWPDLKEKTIKRKTRQNGATAKKLYHTGDLVRSIDYSADFNQISVGALNENTGVYAPVHNEGLQAGRGAGFTMPQRQFMPIPDEDISQSLKDKIDAQIEHDLNAIFNS